MTTKKQHFVTAGYIAQFSASIVDEKIRESQVFYHDKRRLWSTFSIASEKILYEDWYFEINSEIINTPNEINLIENTLRSIESEFLKIVKNRDSFAELTNNEKEIVLHFMLSLYMRSPRKREEILKDLTNAMSQKYQTTYNVEIHRKTLSVSWRDPNVFDRINCADWKSEIAKMLHSLSVIGYIHPNPQYQATYDIFNQYIYQFVRITNEDEFISWDNPVVYWSRSILFPISRKFCLVWVLRSEVGKMKFEIDDINQAIASNATNVIFWSNKDLIEKYKGLVWDKNLEVLKYLDK